MRLASCPRLADPELAEEDPELAKVEPEVEPEDDEMEVEPLPNNRRTPLNTINAQEPIIIEPTRLFDYAPVSAGPLRRGQTVCGGSSSNNIEGSSSKDVVEERPLEEILKERPLSVRTLHRLASATLERAGKKFEYLREEEVSEEEVHEEEEVLDNSALAGSSSGESTRAQPAPVSPHEDSPRRRPAPYCGMVMQWQGGMPRMVGPPIRSRLVIPTKAEGPSAHRPAHIPDERT